MNKTIPFFVFVAVLAIGMGMTLVVYRAEVTANRVRFESVADDVVGRIRENVEDHIAYLAATQSYFSAQEGMVTQKSFETFAHGVNGSGRFTGIKGIGFARVIEVGNETSAELELARHYGIERKIWPETEAELRTPIVLLEPQDEANRVALGYDMFSETLRREAMRASLKSGKVRASAPVELVQETSRDKQRGFLVYIPFDENLADRENSAGVRPSMRKIAGFVYAPFRAGDLHRRVLAHQPGTAIAIRTMDTTEGEPSLLYASPNFDAKGTGGRYSVQRTFEIAGRNWTSTIRDTEAFASGFSYLNTFALTAISLLLAMAIAISTWSQLRAVASARQVRDMSETAIREKELMLQEMKHRIKNSIARILAMARQTAVNSESIDEFSTSFSARLQSMANAQDLLTQASGQEADLGDVLRQELEQVFGPELKGAQIEGPSVHLSAPITEALGLTFHELATNALKHGGMAGDKGGVSVRWKLGGDAKSKTLVLDWIETSSVSISEPTRRGFGSKLIDAKISGELYGKIDRDFHEDGLRVRISVPLK